MTECMLPGLVKGFPRSDRASGCQWRARRVAGPTRCASVRPQGDDAAGAGQKFACVDA